MVKPRNHETATPRTQFVPATIAVIASLCTLLVAIGFAVATPAAAHSDLTSSTPASGDVVDTAPPEITLVFNEEIGQTGLQVVAQGPAGSVPLGTPTVTGNTIAVPWPQDAGGGDFRVSYRVVSADGHPIDGTISFTVSGAPTASSPAGAATSPGSAAATPTNSTADSDSDLPMWIPAVVVVVGVMIGAAIARALRHRRVRETDSPVATRE